MVDGANSSQFARSFELEEVRAIQSDPNVTTKKNAERIFRGKNGQKQTASLRSATQVVQEHNHDYVTHGLLKLRFGTPRIVGTTGAALHENNEATAKSTSQDGGMAVNFG